MDGLRLTVSALVAVALVSGGALAAAEPKAGGEYAAARTVLRLARSTDGLDFGTPGDLFLAGASAPDLIRLPNDDLLAVFDYAESTAEPAQTVLAVSRSRDEGRSWSRLRAVSLRGRGIDALVCRHGDLVSARPGWLRLYFTAAEKADSTDAGHRTIIRSAVTRNGVDYLLDPEAGFRIPGLLGGHATTIVRDSDVHLYVGSLWGLGRESDQRWRVAEHLVSTDGRRFDRSARVRTGRAVLVGSVIELQQGYRAYVSAVEGIQTFVSPNGRTWRPERELCVKQGWDPAVVRLIDGSFLMLYCAALSRLPAEAPREGGVDGAARHQEPGDPTTVVALVSPAREGGTATDDAEWSEWASDAPPGWLAESGDEVGSLSEAPAQLPEPDGEFTELPTLDEEAGTAGIATTDGLNIDTGIDAAAAGTDGAIKVEADGQSLAGSDGLGEAGGEWAATDGLNVDAEVVMDWATDGYPPLPDFERSIDYREWYREVAVREAEDNAWETYVQFLPSPWAPEGEAVDLPELKNLFVDPGYSGPPGPWDPVEHPEWEASNEAAAEVLERFREASFHADYAFPARFYYDGQETPGEGLLLLELKLYGLSEHRGLARATLADAWRAEDGYVSSDQILDALETTLRNADHLAQGTTLIEQLVSMAEQRMVQDTARRALEHQLFGESELETGFELLRTLDRDRKALPRLMRGEHAVSMEAVQFMFAPTEPGQGPSFNYDNASYLADITGLAEPDAFEEAFGAYSPEDIDRLVDDLNRYHRTVNRQARIGYPEVRRTDLTATHERIGAESPSGKHLQMLTPNLGRVLQVQAETEASRRATQLSYATHLFKVRTGRWPETLSELPPEWGEQMRIDPFTGRHFGYRLTADGPRIYSRSENGRDDGGVHTPGWHRGDGESDDYVFWPPQTE